MKKIGLIVLVLLMSCGTSKKQNVIDIDYETLSYAKGFKIGHGEGFSVLEVVNPWDTTKLLNRYVLIDRDIEKPKELPKGEVVYVPIERVAVANGVHAGLLDMFSEIDKIVAVCEAIYMPIKVQEKVKLKEIEDLGVSTMPNTERLVISNADIMIVSPFQNQGYGWAEKIGTPIIECAAYMEQLPLGQAEWLKFHGLFYGKKEIADSLFSDVEYKYNQIKKMVEDVDVSPTVIAGKCYGQAWWVAAGESYAAQLYKDAGGDYMWSDTEGTGSISLSFEAVYDLAHDADLWLVRYNSGIVDMTYDMLRSENELYSEFDAFKQQNVYGCNTGNVPYYERATFRPDEVLSDLVKIMHPELTKNIAFKYYKRVTE